MYSCAYFRRAEDTLELAQEQKLDHICRKLMLKPGERFLDIGCGWGALILWAAEHYQVRATGITLSQNQYEYARAAHPRARASQDLCEVRLLDYRDVPEDAAVRQDRERRHVRARRAQEPAACTSARSFALLKPGRPRDEPRHHAELGRRRRSSAATSARSSTNTCSRAASSTHISRVIEEMSEQGLESWDVESLRPHYARTLWHWVERLEANREAALAKVGEKIYRIWRIYMAGSRARIRARLDVGLPGPRRQSRLADGRLGVPSTREYIYAA